MKLAILTVFAVLAVCHVDSYNRPARYKSPSARGPLIWQEEFDALDYSRWKHLITAWRGGNNEFQYYDNLPENSYVRNGVLYIKPTLTADRFGEDFLYNGVIDLNQEGCNIPTEILAISHAAVNSDSHQVRGPIIWQDEFEFLDYGKWMHLITAWRGGNQEFQYYHNLTENSYVRDGVLYIKPTLTADRFSEDFLYNGELDFNTNGIPITLKISHLIIGNAIILTSEIFTAPRTGTFSTATAEFLSSQADPTAQYSGFSVNFYPEKTDIFIFYTFLLKQKKLDV